VDLLGCTARLRAAQILVRQGIRVGYDPLLLRTSAAATCATTRGTKERIYLSPFVGRLDDVGQNSTDLVKNIKQMFSTGDGHVRVLAAIIRALEHLLYSFCLNRVCPRGQPWAPHA
jgi:transaldolase